MIDFVSCNRCKLVCSCCSFSTLIDVKRPLSFSPIPPCPSSLPSWPYIVALDALASHTFLPSLAAQQQLQIDCNTLDCHIPCTRSRKVCHKNHKICAIQLVSYPKLTRAVATTTAISVPLFLSLSLTHTHEHALLGAKVFRAPQTEKFP